MDPGPTDVGEGPVSDGRRTQPSTDRPFTAKDLVTFFVDQARTQNQADPPRKVVGHFAREAATLLKEKHSRDILESATEILVDKGLDPSSLASCVFTAQSLHRKDGLDRDARRLLRDFLTELQRDHGLRWPTGTRYVRNIAAGRYVEDPLGIDKPEHKVPWQPPSKGAIVAALRQSGWRARHTPSDETSTPQSPEAAGADD